MYTYNKEGGIFIKQLNNKTKEIITVVLGLCIVIGRVIVPTYFGITKASILFELFLEIIIFSLVIYLNRNKIKTILGEAKNDKFGNFIKKSLFVFLWLMIGALVFGNIVKNIFKFEVVLGDIGSDFMSVLPIATLISQIVIAPITEELAFRMTLRDIIPNKTLFVIISAILFAFIHDWFLFSGGIIMYFALGIVFNILYLKVKDIRYMIGGHVVNNIMSNIFQIISKIRF